MKTLLILAAMLMMFLGGGASVYYADAWYFETHTGGTRLADVYEAERICEEMTRQHCSLSGNFMPDSFFAPSRAAEQNWI